jgi:hypothetical protein
VQLKGELKLAQCSSEQLVNGEDQLNTEEYRVIEEEKTRRLHSDLK